MSQNDAGADGRGHALALGLLLLAFLFRVVSQLVQLWRPVRWLPPFEAWHSGALPYPVLVVAQILIIGFSLWCIVEIASRRMRRNRRAGRLLGVLGWIYFAGMAMRLLLGLTALHQVRWFDAPLPAFFHLVLAAMVLTLASYHLRDGLPQGSRPSL